MPVLHAAPPGYQDMVGDAEHVETTTTFRDLDVEGVGTLRARKPMPNAIPNLGMAYSTKSDAIRMRHLKRFLRNHVEDFDTILDRMMDDELPADTVERIANAVATWGTARPTGPSSACV